MRGLRERVRYVHTEDGHRLAVTELVDPRGSSGAGEAPVLLVHGFAQNRLAFALGHLPRALVDKGARVFLGELRGHGLSRSAVPEAALARQEWGLGTHLHQDLPALTRHVLEQAGAERLHFMGHSMGGILGYAALASDPPFRSLTGWAAPVLLGAGQPIVHAASWVVPPLMRAGRPARVPMDRLLGALAGVLSEPEAAGPKRWLQRLAGLSNPNLARPQDLAAIFGGSDPESSKVFFELSQMSARRRPKVAGVDLVAAIHAWPGPVAAVVGEGDRFAGPKSVSPLERLGHRGARRILCIPGGTHVDVAMGHHLPETVDALWRFLVVDTAEGEE